MIESAKVNRFWANVDTTAGRDACWPWLGWKDETGRGRFQLNGAKITAPRAALIIEKGEPKESDLHACHTCDNPECCNPAHLWWGTRSDNMRDMGRKGRSGIQRHPGRYKRTRRSDVKYRPVRQPNAPPGIDHRTNTRYAMEGEVELAKKALVDLEKYQNRIVLVPAPDPHFEGHKIRQVESSNPDWYVGYGEKYWNGPRKFQLKRHRVIRALQRVVKGRVRGNGYEKDILEWLKEHPPGVQRD